MDELVPETMKHSLLLTAKNASELLKATSYPSGKEARMGVLAEAVIAAFDSNTEIK
jgi:hypothetical protein